MKHLLYQDSTGKTRELYDGLIAAYGTKSLPLFFTYIGPYPEYLEYISEQLITNLNAKEFEALTVKISQTVATLVDDVLPKTPRTQETIERYKYSPSFIQFQKDLRVIIMTNTKLAITFLALREAVKGWAIAAKKLPSQASGQNREEVLQKEEKDFLLDANYSLTVTQNREEESRMVRTGDITQNDNSIERNSLPEYLELTYQDILTYKKSDPFWILRIHLEKHILSKLDELPSLIFSPINIVYRLTSKYPDFGELIYLLSEDFPTLSMHRLLLSGYMRV